MTRPLSNDLRRRVVEAVDSGMTRRAAARRYGVGEATAIRWVARWRRTGSWEPEKMGSRSPRSPLEGLYEEILALVEARPDVTLSEVVEHLRVNHGVETSTSAVDRFFVRHEVTFKKRRRMPPNRNDQT
ncbi:Conserved protein of unknown function [Magnetospira sp. QH-2]|nr:Conserved protein of unknown function [Magnetospira sp. QH-2]